MLKRSCRYEQIALGCAALPDDCIQCVEEYLVSEQRRRDQLLAAVISLRMPRLPVILRDPGFGLGVSCWQVQLTESGQVQSCGRNDLGEMNGVRYGSLGHSDINVVIPWEDPVPIPALMDQKILSIASYEYGASVFAISQRNLYAWGAGQNGELGDGRETSVRLLPHVILQLPLDDRWVQLAVGDRISAAVTQKGLLYTWGFNCWGAGHGGVCNTCEPTVPLLFKELRIVYASCRLSSMTAVTDSGRVLCAHGADFISLEEGYEPVEWREIDVFDTANLQVSLDLPEAIASYLDS